jgi:hypothetical protein
MEGLEELPCPGVCHSMNSPIVLVTPACAIPKPTAATSIRIAATTTPILDDFIFLPLLSRVRFGYPFDPINKVSFY